MTFKYFVIPTAFAAALSLSATSASAQHRSGEFHGRSFHAGVHEHGRFAHGRVGRFHDGHFARPFVGVRVIRPLHGPYFAFRPRFGLGFGLYVGWPVPYPWDYVAVYPYAATYPSYVGEGTPYSDYGGVSFDVTPGDAMVMVDGNQVGTVQTFSPQSAPLTLEPGQHHVVIEKPGYQPMTFDVDVIAGQVIPYQGTMQR